MPAVSVRELWVRLCSYLPEGGLELCDPDRPVIIVAELGNGTSRALSCDDDVQELVARRGGKDDFVEIEVRDLFPTPGAPPSVITMPMACLVRPAEHRAGATRAASTSRQHRRPGGVVPQSLVTSPPRRREAGRPSSAPRRPRPASAPRTVGNPSSPSNGSGKGTGARFRKSRLLPAGAAAPASPPEAAVPSSAVADVGLASAVGAVGALRPNEVAAAPMPSPTSPPAPFSPIAAPSPLAPPSPGLVPASLVTSAAPAPTLAPAPVIAPASETASPAAPTPAPAPAPVPAAMAPSPPAPPAEPSQTPISPSAPARPPSWLLQRLPMEPTAGRSAAAAAASASGAATPRRPTSPKPVHPALGPVPGDEVALEALLPGPPPSAAAPRPAPSLRMLSQPSRLGADEEGDDGEASQSPSPSISPSSAASQRRRGGGGGGGAGALVPTTSLLDCAVAEEATSVSGASYAPIYDGRPGRLHDEAWEDKRGELSTHLMEAIGLREEYESLRYESARRRHALEWLLRTRDTVPGPYSINLRPKSESGCESPLKACFSCVSDTDMVLTSTGPQDWDKGEFWPVKNKDVRTLGEAIEKLQNMEGTAAVRLQDQAVFAHWRLKNARRKMTEEHGASIGVPLSPKRVLVESPWLKFGDFAKVAFRVYPCGDGTAQSGNSTVFIWMARPPGLSFTFNLRIGDSLSTAPRLWQATMIHYRMDLRWSQLSTALLPRTGGHNTSVSTTASNVDSLNLVLQVLQWHGPEDRPTEWSPEHQTNVSLAIEMLQGAANSSVAALADHALI